MDLLNLFIYSSVIPLSSCGIVFIITVIVLSWCAEDERLRPVCYIICAFWVILLFLTVGMWMGMIENGMTVDMKQRYPNLTLNIFLIFTFILSLGILFLISCLIIWKWFDKMKKIFLFISSNLFKSITIIFACMSVFITATAYSIGFYIVSYYNLSPSLLVPDVGQAVYGIIGGGAFLALTIGTPIWIYKFSKHKMISFGNQNKNLFRILSITAHTAIVCLVQIAIYTMLYVICARPLWKFSHFTMSIITIVFLSLSLITSIIHSILYYRENTKKTEISKMAILMSHKKSEPDLIKIIISTAYIIFYALLLFIAICNLGASVFTPHSKYQYEYITTEKWGDCVILMKNGTQYILEKFSFDENSGTITIYTDKYYVENINSAEIKRISYQEEVRSNKNSE